MAIYYTKSNSWSIFIIIFYDYRGTRSIPISAVETFELSDNQWEFF